MNKKFLDDGVTPNPNYKPEFLEDGVTPNPEFKKETEDERIERLAEEKAAAKLKDIKGKLDTAYSARDAALAEAEALKLKEREAQKQALEEQGKYKELYELKLKEQEEEAARLKAEKAELENRNTELTRDNELRDALKGYDFRNARASDIAFRDIVGELTRNDQGVWVHKSGVSIKDYATAFAKDESNSFLFKPKQNGGAGSSGSGNHKPNPTAGKKLTEMSQADVLRGIKDGTIKHR
jgi:hypothetical protein